MHTRRKHTGVSLRNRQRGCLITGAHKHMSEIMAISPFIHDHTLNLAVVEGCETLSK